MPFFGGGGASAGIGGSTGATDNAILRADGTGAATLQNSALVIDDPISPFSVTGVASTDVFTAVGHNFTANQCVRFLTTTGGGNFFTGVNYFVRDISGDTFKLSLTSGGAARDLTTDMTAGTIVAMQENLRIANNTADTNSFIVLSPKGTGGLILGPRPDGTATGGNIRGTNAVDLQINRFNSVDVAGGIYSFCVGSGNSAQTDFAVAMGRLNIASGSASFCANRSNTASSDSTACLGEANTASVAYGFAVGHNSVANRRSFFAHASGNFSAAGDAQRIRAVLRCKTTTNSAVEMALDGSTTYLTIPSGKVMFCNIKVTGVKSDGATVATYERQYAAKNVAGTSSEVFAPVTIGTDNASGTTLEVATVDAGDYIRIRPTGIASETWRWVASVDAVEVAYGT